MNQLLEVDVPAAGTIRTSWSSKAMLMSAFLLEESGISNYDVRNISRQLDGLVMMTSAVMPSQSAAEQNISAVDKRSARDGATSFNS
ncbi:hypothetical protein F511_40933 [Dorcoceras hygrometricum]|uniref:Uncharacterized protein n=1 Tax=Dorcoceras hygrometricum TaxID=472368 RepID=A0A2Z7BIG1_9LAMI|nr:hypothetical protein F511_40933 [Dorcoceras hygrometricum]